MTVVKLLKKTGRNMADLPEELQEEVKELTQNKFYAQLDCDTPVKWSSSPVKVTLLSTFLSFLIYLLVLRTSDLRK